MKMLQQSAHSSKAGQDVYGLATVHNDGGIIRGTNLVEQIHNTSMQGSHCEYPTAFYPQAGDLDSKEAATDEGCCDLKSTAFVDDEGSRSVTFGKPTTLDHVTVKDMSILDFLAKPNLAADITWSTVSTNNSIIYSSSINDLLTLNAYWANKIQGFALYRGTACFKLAINANPFQAGRLLLHFLPHVSSRVTDPSYLASHNVNLTTKTQQPHIEVDARDSSCIMKIPYVSPTNFVKAKSSSEFFDWGNIYVSILSALNVGATAPTTVDCALYMWFEDFELAGPTIPQGGNPGSKKFKVKTISREGAEMSEKPISKALMLGSQAADSLSSIPLISAVASSASWALRMASGVASVFGWSKPISEASPGVMTKQYNRYAATSAGSDCSYPMSILPDSRIVVNDSVSIRDEDEMSFAFLKGVAALTDRITWLNSATSGTSIYSSALSPQTIYQAGTTTYSTHTTVWRTGPPIYYLSNFFSYWRGSFKLVIKLIKTEFHSGRLQITWTPRGYGTSATPTLSTGLLSQRWLVDIRESNTIELELPWYIATNYLPCNVPSGTLDILVLNELRNPESAPNSIDILMYYRGGDDFEFQSPGVYKTNSIIPTPFSPQSGDQMTKSGAIGGEAPKRMDTLASCASMGELFTSVKQLISRQAVVPIKTWPSNHGISVWPWFISMLSMNGSTGNITYPQAGSDTISIIAPMYAMYRGSMVVSVRTATADALSVGVTSGRNNSLSALVQANTALESPNTVSVIGNIQINATADGVYNTYNDWTALGCGVAITDAGNGMASFSVPYYCTTKSSLTMAQTSVNTIPAIVSTPTSLLSVYGRGFFTTTTDAGLYRSAGDDFQLSYFIGCPPIMYSYT